MCSSLPLAQCLTPSHVNSNGMQSPSVHRNFPGSHVLLAAVEIGSSHYTQGAVITQFYLYVDYEFWVCCISNHSVFPDSSNRKIIVPTLQMT